MIKKKILVILSSNYYHKYLAYCSFQNLEKKYDVSYFVKKNNFKKSKKYKFYELDLNNKYILRYFNLIRLRSLKKIPSLKSPLLFRFPTYKYYKKIFHKKYQKLPLFFYIKKFFLKKVFYKIFAISILLNIYKYFLSFKIRKKTELDICIERVKPNIIIYPTHFMEPEIMYINRSAKVVKAKTFFIVDNWDNLTTKAAMVKKVDYLGVWGEQSRQHAIKFHGYKKNNIFLLGNNRIDEYFIHRKHKFKNIVDIKEPYLLFLGTNILFREELKSLKILDKKINQNNLNSKLKIIYRFHPQLPKNFIKEFTEINFDNIKLNFPLKKFSYLKERNLIRKKTQSIDYFPLIQNAKYLMGMTVTTVTLEGFIFGKNYILLDCMDEDSAHISKIINKYSEYQKGIDRINIFHRVKSYNNFFKVIEKKEKKISSIKLDKKINYFYYCKNTNYQSKVFESVNKIFNENEI
jgi:hypothetical protein